MSLNPASALSIGSAAASTNAAATATCANATYSDTASVGNKSRWSRKSHAGGQSLLSSRALWRWLPFPRPTKRSRLRREHSNSSLYSVAGNTTLTYRRRADVPASPHSPYGRSGHYCHQYHPIYGSIGAGTATTVTTAESSLATAILSHHGGTAFSGIPPPPVGASPPASPNMGRPSLSNNGRSSSQGILKTQRQNSRLSNRSIIVPTDVVVSFAMDQQQQKQGGEGHDDLDDEASDVHCNETATSGWYFSRFLGLISQRSISKKQITFPRRRWLRLQRQCYAAFDAVDIEGVGVLDEREVYAALLFVVAAQQHQQEPHPHPFLRRDLLRSTLRQLYGTAATATGRSAGVDNSAYCLDRDQLVHVAAIMLQKHQRSLAPATVIFSWRGMFQTLLTLMVVSLVAQPVFKETAGLSRAGANAFSQHPFQPAVESLEDWLQIQVESMPMIQAFTSTLQSIQPQMRVWFHECIPLPLTCIVLTFWLLPLVWSAGLCGLRLVWNRLSNNRNDTTQINQVDPDSYRSGMNTNTTSHVHHQPLGRHATSINDSRRMSPLRQRSM